MQAKKGDWVKVHRVVLGPEERAPQVPDDTKAVPLEMWVKGFLHEDEAAIGDEVTVTTLMKREEKGTLMEIKPSYDHSFGAYIPELVQIGVDLREILFGGEGDE